MRKILLLLGCLGFLFGCHNVNGTHKRHKKPPRKTKAEIAAEEAAQEQLQEQAAQAEQARMREPIGKKEADIILKEGNPTSIKTLGGIEIVSYISNAHTTIDSDTQSTSKGFAIVSPNPYTDLAISRAKGDQDTSETVHQSFFEKDYFFKKGICVDYKEINNN